MKAYGIFKAGERRKTRAGARFKTPMQAWDAVMDHLSLPLTTSVQSLKDRGYAVKLLTVLWYAEVDGTCTLVRAADAVDALTKVRRDVGERASIRAIRPASKTDVSWFKVMSGKKQ